jgi:hypothetical protein
LGNEQRKSPLESGSLNQFGSKSLFLANKFFQLVESQRLI